MLKRKLKKSFFLLCLFSITACNEVEQSKVTNIPQDRSYEENQNQQVIRKLNPPDFNKLLKANKQKQLIDVRLASEIRGMGYIEGAKFIERNIYKINRFEKELASLDKNTPIFLYCTKGKRSDEAQVFLEELGYKEVYDLVGGLQAWKYDYKFPTINASPELINSLVEKYK